MKMVVDNSFKCFMFIPNVNYWYKDDEPAYIFIGWLKWGIFIILKEVEDDTDG